MGNKNGAKSAALLLTWGKWVSRFWMYIKNPGPPWISALLIHWSLKNSLCRSRWSGLSVSFFSFGLSLNASTCICRHSAAHDEESADLLRFPLRCSIHQSCNRSDISSSGNYENVKWWWKQIFEWRFGTVNFNSMVVLVIKIFPVVFNFSSNKSLDGNKVTPLTFTTNLIKVNEVKKLHMLLWMFTSCVVLRPLLRFVVFIYLLYSGRACCVTVLFVHYCEFLFCPSVRPADAVTEHHQEKEDSKPGQWHFILKVLVRPLGVTVSGVSFTSGIISDTFSFRNSKCFQFEMKVKRTS